MSRSRFSASSLRAFLQPGWVFSVVAVVLFSYFAFSFLAPWQLGKNERVSARNAAISRALDTAPVALNKLISPETSISAGLEAEQEWTRVEVAGKFVPQGQVLLRLRSVNSAPAYQILTPFQPATGGPLLLVNRGFVPAEGTKAPEIPAPPTEQLTITGFLRADEPAPEREPVFEYGFWQLHGIHVSQAAELCMRQQAVACENTPFYGFWLQLAAGSPGEVTAIPLPQLESGPYLSYGIQWIAFGIMAPLGLAYFIRAELRERRRVQEDLMLLAAAETNNEVAPEHLSNPAAPDAPAAAAAPRHRARYGQRRDHFASDAKKQRERF